LRESLYFSDELARLGSRAGGIEGGLRHLDLNARCDSRIICEILKHQLQEERFTVPQDAGEPDGSLGAHAFLPGLNLM
jgi:hypothetical protein